MFNWAFRTTENVVKGAVSFSAPIVNKFDAPINYVDQTIVQGKVEFYFVLLSESLPS